jgi:hypothetical protein
MQRADTLDRLLIFAALLFFGLVCLFIIKRRILDRGLRIVGVIGKLAPGRALGAKKEVKEAVTGLVASATSLVGPATSSLLASHITAPESGTIVIPPVPTQQPTHGPPSSLDHVLSSILPPHGFDVPEGPAEGADVWPTPEPVHRGKAGDPVVVHNEL